MKIHREKIDLSIFVLGFILIGLIFAITAKTLPSFANDGADTQQDASKASKHFVTIYDHGSGNTVTIRTEADTVAEALERANVHIDLSDVVEPALSDPLTSENFHINVYRARPVIVIDGIRQYKIMAASSDPLEIVKLAGVELYEADVVKITTTNNFIESGLPIAYTVVRAKTISFNYYGQIISTRTGASTVGQFLSDRGITLTDSDWLSLSTDTAIVDGLELAIFRQGKSTVTAPEEIAFSEQYTHDYSYNMGYRAVTRSGELGQKTVTYEVEMKDGKEISRTFVSEIITKEPVPQLVTLGARAISMNVLTKQMGRNRYTTSTGILREETYYDLNMKVVMGNCSGGGYYTVRADGVKIDKDGYVIIAANLNRYPRCSIVETSLGLGKVYDTGSFAAGNPEQFDIATDWSRRDGI